MKALTNPYTPNAGAEPQAVVGRDDQLESFDLLLARIEAGRTEQSMIITGRGVGYTPDALTEAVDITGGYPYFLQELGYAVWTIADGPRWSSSTAPQPRLKFRPNNTEDQWSV